MLNLPLKMAAATTILFALFLVIPFVSSTALPSHEAHFIKKLGLRNNATTPQPQEYLEIRPPLSTDSLTPTCVLPALQYDFGDTMNLPPVTTTYSPPPNCTWSRVTLHLSASCKGEQYDRIAAVWLEGAELLRTSTAEPTEDGVFWNVRKDVTRYTSLLSQDNLTLAVMLENLIDDVFTGIYYVNITFLYYDDTNSTNPVDFPSRNFNRKVGFESLLSLNGNDDAKMKSSNGLDLYEKPANIIIPVSAAGDGGYWFRIESESDVHRKVVEIPKNVYKAVLEVCVSFHGNDEFWYSNPPNSYFVTNNLTLGRRHGAYREVLVMIDNYLVGSVVPFPVIFTGGVNPLFWEPVVAIGAFDLPTYDVDLTPFLGLLLDGRMHSVGLGVAEGISFWLVNGNLHLWLDGGAEVVQASSADLSAPKFELEWSSSFQGLDGVFEVEAKRKTRFSGWVNSSLGNLTTDISNEIKFENSIKFSENGNSKVVKQKVKTESEVKISSDMGVLVSRTVVKRTYPLSVTTLTSPGTEPGTSLMTTSIDLSLKEKITKDKVSSSLNNRQQSSGWMFVQDHNVLSGAATTDQSYVLQDGSSCYSRVVSAANGQLMSDSTSFLCSSPL